MKSARTGPAPERLWTLDPAALRDGDVILEFGGSIKSAIISAFDGGPYSHALIWVGNNDVVESVGGGVRNLSFERVLIEDPALWTLLHQPDRTLGQRAALAARRLVSKHYNTKGAFRSLGPGAGVSDPGAVFCSELVAQAYLDAGVEVVPGLPPQKVTPRALLHSGIFTQMELTLRECDPARIQQLFGSLDRDEAYRDSLMDKEVRVSRAAFADVESLVRGLPLDEPPGVRHPPGNLSELIDALARLPAETSCAVMDALFDSLQSRGYFHLFDRPFADAREHFIKCRIQLQFGGLPNEEREGVRAYLRRTCDGYNSTIQRYLQNALACEGLVMTNPHSLWRALAEMHRRNYQMVLFLRTLGNEAASYE